MNIVYIHSHDTGRYIQPYGHAIPTPNLQQLAEEGVLFKSAFCANPTCSPSRAALLTGRYPIRTGAITPQEVLGYDRIGLEETTIADSFKSSGYTTGMVGKWHNGALDPRFHPNARGFDEFIGFRGGWADYYKWNLDRNGSSEKSDGRYLTDVLAEEAVGFISRHSNEQFFLMITWNAPHSPLQAPEDITQKYVDAGFDLGIAVIYAMIEVMDSGIGKVRQALDSAGIADDTILMFTSDNGPAFTHREDQISSGMSVNERRFNCGFAGAKASVYEGGIRVPMIAKWANGLPMDIDINEQFVFTDWLPTLLSLAGASHIGNKPLDGYDMTSVLRGETSNFEPRRFWQWNHYSPIGITNAAIRDGSWKLVRPALNISYATDTDQSLSERYVEKDIEYKYHPENINEIFNWEEPERLIPDPPNPELYNIDSDPGEEVNLADSNPEVARRLLIDLESWFEEVEKERQSLFQ